MARQRQRPPAARRTRGVGLVELMISITLGLVVLAGIGWIYLGTVRTYRSHDALSRMQEGARQAFELISNDLRMAGATGCSHGTRANVLNGSSAWFANLFDQPVLGVEMTGTAGVTLMSDSLSVLHADITREYIVQAHDPASAQFFLTAPHNLHQGDLLLATDCNHAAVFQVTAATGNVVEHAASGTPGNSTANLGANNTPYTYAAGSRLYRLSAVTYYVAVNEAGVPSLFRQRPTGTSATPTAEELVEGVEDLQLAFGVDTSVPANRQPDFVDPDTDGDPYLTATQVESAAVPGATVEERWGRVASVRVRLLMCTAEDRVVDRTQHYAFNGVSHTATDLRLRKGVTHVVKLRNR
jgi:type IV pilus assembly protein PilW